MGVNGAQTIVTGMPPGGLYPQFSGHEVQLIMEDDNVLWIDLIEARRFANGAAALIHKGLRFEQQGLYAPKAPFAAQPLKLLALRRKVVVCGNGVDGHKADIVARLFIFRARIAKADE